MSRFVEQVKRRRAAAIIVVVLVLLAVAVCAAALLLPHETPIAPTLQEKSLQPTPMLVNENEGDVQGDGSNADDDEDLGDVDELAKEATEDAETESDDKTEIDDGGASTEGGGSGKGGPGGGGTDPTGEDVDVQASIITDLETRAVAESELDAEGMFEFYAYLSSYDGYELKVKLKNDVTSSNGTSLKSDNGRDYATKLELGVNFVILYLKRGTETAQRVVYMLTYVADTADEDNPTRGDNPPTITTNLDGTNCIIKNQNFILRVKARTYEGDVIYSNHITVKVDGTELTKPTGTSTFEYDVHFEQPRRGDSENHKITVVAWDDKGNSRFVGYNVEYQYVAEGDKIGTMTIRVDMTTLGLGITDEFDCDILQGKTLPYTLVSGLEEQGYQVQHGGSMDNGFYLSRLSRSNIAKGASVPTILWANVLKDGLNLTGKKSRDSVGEFDYTQGSGWMYCINSTAFPGRSMAGYYPNDGDVISLRFTLAYGKDIGSTDTENALGDLARYCGTWVEDTYTPSHDFSDAKVTKEPTCTQEGVKTVTCPRCGTEQTESIPALGHDWEQTARVEPTDTQDGYVEWTCKNCEETKRDALPATGGGSTLDSGGEQHDSFEGKE